MRGLIQRLRRNKKGDISVQELQPYEQLAEVYDYLMRHVDYVEWADYVEDVFRHFDHSPQRIFEVACGTGTLALELTGRGYEVHATDHSSAMVKAASSKLNGSINGPFFSVADMRDLPQADADAVLCLYDSVNYNLTQDDLRATIASMRRVVHKGALCIFDVTTETNSVLYFSHYESKERHRGFSYTRRSEYRKKERLQINEFFIRHRDRADVVHERHEQRIYPIDDVLSMVNTDEWRILGVFDDYTLDPADGTSERIHVVLIAL